MSRRVGSLLQQAIANVKVDPGAGDAVVDAPPQADAPEEPGFLAQRFNKFEDMQRLTKKPTIRVRPDECSIWSGNARDYAALSEPRVRSLIDSIIAEGGNRIPIVVRRTADAEKPFEVLVGTRRHWAVAWLNANHYSDMRLIAIEENLDDEAAFRLADVENREREDISDMERARNYKAAIERYYSGKQKRMAERLKLSEGHLSRILALNDFPAKLIPAFASEIDITASLAAKLAPNLKNPAARARMEQAAAEISKEQSMRQAEGHPAIPPHEVLARLLHAAAVKRGRPARPELRTTGGVRIGQLVSDDARKGLTLTLLPDQPLSVDEILEELRPVIENARFRGASGKRR